MEIPIWYTKANVIMEGKQMVTQTVIQVGVSSRGVLNIFSKIDMSQIVYVVVVKLLIVYLCVTFAVASSN